jgi:DNA recombination protein RmuC
MILLSELLILIIGIIIGFIPWLFTRQKTKSEYQRVLALLSQEIAVAKERIVSLQNACEELKNVIREKEGKISELEQIIAGKNIDLAELRVKYDGDYKHLEEKIAFLNSARDQLKTEFQALAGQILEEKSKVFTAQNKDNIDLVLTPLKEQLKDFKSRVEEVYVKESEGRAALINEIGHLKNISLQISEDADNLTQALKGDNKTQGNWGELILERALEMSGLERGREFETQFHTMDENGSRYIPDAVVHLPNQRDVIVDSKVSLSDYEAYCSSDLDTERSDFLKKHIQSIRRHIQNLSDKNYDQLPEIHSLDYVLMFLPIEGALIAALKADDKLFADAFLKNIILVCPSTLLVTLKVIAYTWRIQKQTDNAQMIARKAADLYDKFAGFVEILDGIGIALQKASEKYESAKKALVAGKGSLVKRVEDLRLLGVSTKKELPKEIIDIVESESEDVQKIIN